MPRLRQENRIVENEINSSLQTYLYDFLYEQQDLYFKYDNIFRSLNLKPRNEELPFKDFILNFDYYLNEIQNDKNKIKQLKKLRWYICIIIQKFLILFKGDVRVLTCYKQNATLFYI